MRIGLHTGSLIAGCIGTKTLRYDIWGSDCLCANAMESSGRPSCVVLSEATHTLVASQLEGERIVCRPYETVAVKGLGNVETFVIPVSDGAKQELAAYERERTHKPGDVRAAAH